MTIGVSLCLKCSRFRPGVFGDDDGFETGTCDAFPDGIPVDIFAGGFDHRSRFGDEELLFEPRPGVTPAEVEQIVALAAELDDDD